MLGAAGRSTGLIALAVAIGVVLLQLSDDSTERLAAGEAVEVDTPRQATTTTSLRPSTTTTTVTAENGPTVLVLNASGRDNQARPLSERLRAAGYETLEPGNASRREASVVLCRPDYAADAATLLEATDLDATVSTLDDENEFPDSENAGCVVVIGAG